MNKCKDFRYYPAEPPGKSCQFPFILQKGVLFFLPDKLKHTENFFGKILLSLSPLLFYCLNHKPETQRSEVLISAHPQTRGGVGEVANCPIFLTFLFSKHKVNYQVWRGFQVFIILLIIGSPLWGTLSTLELQEVKKDQILTFPTFVARHLEGGSSC